MAFLDLRMALVLTPLAAGFAALAGCATNAAMADAYDQSLQPWRGETRDRLLASWGQPQNARASDGLEMLTYVVRDDLRSPGQLPTYSTGLGAPNINLGVVPPVVALSCTTRFALRDGHVVSWSFEGLSCGAPH